MAKKPANPQPAPESPEASPPAETAPEASQPEPQPGAPALDAEASPPAPEGDSERPPTWAELNAMADMLERFGRRLLQVEDRAAKMAEVLRSNYGVRL